jgi:hypothetical protein
MGTDIHPIIERKRVGENWKMIYNNNTPDDRDYLTFAILAGVRNYNGITPISQPRGFPADISIGAKEVTETWGYMYDISWVTLDEMENYNDSNGPMMEEPELFMALKGEMKWIRSWGGGEAEIRLIFGVDS